MLTVFLKKKNISRYEKQILRKKKYYKKFYSDKIQWKFKIIDYRNYYNHNLNYRINVKTFFFYRSKVLSKTYIRFKIELSNKKKNKKFKFRINGEIKYSLFNYYDYKIKQTKIYLSIVNKNWGAIRFRGYQNFFPSWQKLMISGSILKVKKNNFNTCIIISNYIDNYYIKRYVFLFSNLICYILNQQQKKLISNFNYCKKLFYRKLIKLKHRYKQYKEFKIFKFFKIIKSNYLRKFIYNKKINKKYKSIISYYTWWWSKLWWNKFYRWKLWYRKYPFQFLKIRRFRWMKVFDTAYAF